MRIDYVPDPAASAGQVVVDVEVASVNYPDVLLVAGGYQALPPLPFVVGGEFAGTISEVGANVTGFAVGDRVFGVCGFGAFAERIAVDAQALHHIPDGLGATSAAAFSVTHETAYHSLRSVAQVRPGETVVVLGAAGGVGSAAVEIAVSLGARVIAAAGSPVRLDFCATLGAHEVVDYQREDLKARLRQLAPSGVNVTLDPVGGTASQRCVRCRGVRASSSSDSPRARSPGSRSTSSCSKARRCSASISGPSPPTALTCGSEMRPSCWCCWRRGRLRPRVTASFPLDRVAEALETVAGRRVLGKAVLMVSPGPRVAAARDPRKAQ